MTKPFIGPKAQTFAQVNLRLNTGACELVAQALGLHRGNIDLLRDCIEIIMHLCMSPNNSTKFLKTKVHEVIIEAMGAYLMEVEFGVEVCSGALLNLITYGHDITHAKMQLLGAGVVSVLVRAKGSTRASYRARESANRILGDQLLHEIHTPTSTRYLIRPLGFFFPYSQNYYETFWTVARRKLVMRATRCLLEWCL